MRGDISSLERDPVVGGFLRSDISIRTKWGILSDRDINQIRAGSKEDRRAEASEAEKAVALGIISKALTRDPEAALFEGFSREPKKTHL